METSPNDQPLAAWQVIVKNVQVLDRSQIKNLTELNIVERFSEETAAGISDPTKSQRHEFVEFGIAFTSPPGWLVQTPPPASPSTPDVVIVGPKTSVSNPAIAFSINRESEPLEVSVSNLRNVLDPLIANGALTIQGETGSQINGYNAYIVTAVGHFEDRQGIEQNVGFTTFLVTVDEMLYTIQYSNDLESYENQVPLVDEVINSIEFSDISFAKVPVGDEADLSNPDLINDPDGSGGYSGTLQTQEEGGGCLIATAAYGSEMAPQVQFLREIRDGKVMTTQSGTAFMTGFNQFYYSFSPAVADYERENPVFKEAVKVTLTPMLTSLTLLNYVDVDSEQEILGYGIGIILLNIGMYFVAPAAAIIAIKNRIKRN